MAVTNKGMNLKCTAENAQIARSAKVGPILHNAH